MLISVDTLPPRFWGAGLSSLRDLFLTGCALVFVDISPVQPTSAVLKEKKRLDLLTAIVKHGGMASVAERLGLVYVVRTREAFRDWDVFRRSLMAFTQTHGVPGMLPTSRELRNFERPDIYQGILYWGGPRVVADLTGLKVDIYWQHFHCVGAQVLSFIDTHGVPGCVRDWVLVSS